MLDINGGEFIILIVVALVVLGPERLPQYAAQLGRLVRDARKFAMKAREQVRSEMGEDFDDVDWQALDPRRYDPRRIVREALLDGDDDPLGLRSSGSSGSPASSDGNSSNNSTGSTSAMTSSEGAGDAPQRSANPYDADAT